LQHAAELDGTPPGSSWAVWIVLNSVPTHTTCPCAGGEGINTPKHAATMTLGTPGVLHGSYSLLIQDEEGQVVDPHSISAGWVGDRAAGLAAGLAIESEGTDTWKSVQQMLAVQCQSVPPLPATAVLC
jgi:hypothetical protein